MLLSMALSQAKHTAQMQPQQHPQQKRMSAQQQQQQPPAAVPCPACQQLKGGGHTGSRLRSSLLLLR
jgi:hypothetical protein